jgi:TonB family protein
MPNVQYFTQLKRIFRMSFSPERPLIAHFRYNRVVVGTVNVTMAMEVGSSGNLNKLFVVKSSGIPGYDEEALRTVRASSPFAAPPQAIMGKDGVLRMTWHFTTYL